MTSASMDPFTEQSHEPAAALAWEYAFPWHSDSLLGLSFSTTSCAPRANTRERRTSNFSLASLTSGSSAREEEGSLATRLAVTPSVRRAPGVSAAADRADTRRR